MTRHSPDYFLNGILWEGYDYVNQAWVKDGKYTHVGLGISEGLVKEGEPCKITKEQGNPDNSIDLHLCPMCDEYMPPGHEEEFHRL